MVYNTEKKKNYTPSYVEIAFNNNIKGSGYVVNDFTGDISILLLLYNIVQADLKSQYYSILYFINRGHFSRYALKCF